MEEPTIEIDLTKGHLAKVELTPEWFKLTCPRGCDWEVWVSRETGMPKHVRGVDCPIYHHGVLRAPLN